MGKKIYNRTRVLIITFFVLGLSLSSVGVVADSLQDIKGFFSNVITIFNDGKQIDLGKDPVSGEEYKPLIVKNRTYIPVRALGEVLDKEITWTQETNRIDIVNKPDQNYDHLLDQVLQGQKKITELEEKVKRLEHRLESKNKQITDIKEMSSYLNDQYYIYNDIRFYIYLSGSVKDVNMKVFIDSRDNAKWDNLRPTEIERFIQDIVEDIRFNFRDASITGYIENDYSARKVVDFSLNSRGRLEVDISNIKDLDDMANHLNNKFSKYQGYDFHVKLYWNLDKIRVDVFVLDTDWFELGEKNREKYLKEVIYKEINKEFPFEGIYGYIFDNYYGEPYTNYIMQEFEFDYNGKLILE